MAEGRFGEADHKPYDEMSDGEFLTAIREYIKTRWMKNGLVSPNGKVCLLGAARLVAADGNIKLIASGHPSSSYHQDVAQQRCADLLAPVLYEQYPDRVKPARQAAPVVIVIRFNDHKATVKDEAIAMIDKAIAHTGG